MNYTKASRYVLKALNLRYSKLTEQEGVIFCTHVLNKERTFFKKLFYIMQWNERAMQLYVYFFTQSLQINLKGLYHTTQKKEVFH